MEPTDDTYDTNDDSLSGNDEKIIRDSNEQMEIEWLDELIAE